jgi:hypothetical protein
VYHYIQSEPGLFTVGIGTPRSQGGTDWDPESDHSTAREAAQRVAYLNGGASDPSCGCLAEIDELRKRIEELDALVQQTRADVGP